MLVTGSSRGLGRAIVEAGLAAGNKVLATARTLHRWLIVGTIWNQVKLSHGLDRRKAAGASPQGWNGTVDYWLTGLGHQQCGIWQSFVRRRHALSEFRASDRQRTS